MAAIFFAISNCVLMSDEQDHFPQHMQPVPFSAQGLTPPCTVLNSIWWTRPISIYVLEYLGFPKFAPACDMQHLNA